MPYSLDISVKNNQTMLAWFLSFFYTSSSLQVLLGKGAENQNGNLRWHLPLGIRPPPPLMAQISRHFFTPLFSFAIESYIYETDFTLQKYHFEVLL